MATSIDTLFEKLNGSKWNAGVTFERTNPVPLDKYTVFKNFNDLSTYADSNPVSYPGQLLATVEEVGGVKFYKVNVDGSVTQLDDTTDATNGVKKQLIGGVVTYSADIIENGGLMLSGTSLSVSLAPEGGIKNIDGKLSIDVATGLKISNGKIAVDLDVESISAASGKIVDSISQNDGKLCVQFRDLTSDVLSGTLSVNGGLRIDGSFDLSGNYHQLSGTHAEGNGTFALGQSSHAEGQDSKAYGIASHAEGNAVSAIGLHSHAEGDNVQAVGSNSHAEGSYSIAVGDYSHAEGLSTLALGEGSHAEGKANYAIAPFGHAEGDGYCYAGTMAFNIITSDIGLSTLTLDTITCDAGSLNDSILKDKWIVIFQRAKTDGNVSATFKTKFCGVVEGQDNTISVSYVPEFIATYKDANVFFPDYPLYGTVSLGSGAHAHGYQSRAMEDATAFGCNNYALGRYSFALGNANKTDYMGIAVGSGNGAFGSHSIAMGGSGSADAKTLDTNTQVYAAKAFGWSGNGKYEVPVGRTGTFNINPVGGLSGVYIGETNLGQYISSDIGSLSDTIKAEISSLSDSVDDQLSIIRDDITNNYIWLSSSLSSLANAIRSDEFLSGGVSYDSQMSTVISAVVLIFSKLSSL